jgi:pimeloyl-ACP methyl ester carboxylesterase
MNPPLIVILPGILGTVLTDPDGVPVWGTPRSSFNSLVLNPTALHIDRPLRPKRLISGTAVHGVSLVPGYGGLVSRVAAELKMGAQDLDTLAFGHVLRKEARLLTFPYDFRQSPRGIALELGEAINERLSYLPPKTEVIMVAHSMGGAVAKWWWSSLGETTVCRALITLGTPHRGSPKALDYLANGIRIGEGSGELLTKSLLAGATDAVREWPSLYALLPRYPVVVDGSSHLYPYQIDSLGETFTLAAARAYREHLELDDLSATASQANPGTLIPYFSMGHATIGRISKRAGSMFAEKEDCDWLPNPGWGGDGTVPAISAIPLEVPMGAARFTCEEHVALVNAAALIPHLRTLTGASLAPVRGGEQPGSNPWIGFDHESVVLSSQPIQLRAVLNGSPTPGIRARAKVVEPSRPAVSYAMTLVEGWWTATIPAMSPGTHRCWVEVIESEDSEPIVGSATFGVVSAQAFDGNDR